MLERRRQLNRETRSGREAEMFLQYLEQRVSGFTTENNKIQLVVQERLGERGTALVESRRTVRPQKVNVKAIEPYKADLSRARHCATSLS